MTRVVFDEESKTGHGFGIEHGQPKYWFKPNVYLTTNPVVCKVVGNKEENNVQVSTYNGDTALYVLINEAYCF